MPTGIFLPEGTGGPLRERMRQVGFHRGYKWNSKRLQCDISIMKCLAANHFTNEILQRDRTSLVVRETGGGERTQRVIQWILVKRQVSSR